jgi:kynureninase
MPSKNISGRKARKFDSKDPLKDFRDFFYKDDHRLIYLDGNSLGMLPHNSIRLMAEEVNQRWGERLIRSFNEKWWDMPSALGKKISKIIGARPDEVIVCDSVSVNLYKLILAALRYNHGKFRVVSDNMNFPSDLYVIQGVIKLLNSGHILELMKTEDNITISDDELIRTINVDTALVSLSYVSFRSAFMYDMDKVSRLAHDHSALILWDLCHAVGAVPVDLGACRADMAVGCTYKYLNGGPGSVAFIYVRKELQEQLDHSIWGWWGEAEPFQFEMNYRPASGIKRFLTGSVPVLSMAALDPALDIVIKAGIPAIRDKSLKLSRYLIDLVKEILVPLGFTLGSPEDDRYRGSHVSICHPEAYRICQALIDPEEGKYTVIPDFRAPDVIRLGLVSLYNSFSDVYHTVREIEMIARLGIYEKYSSDITGVT